MFLRIFIFILLTLSACTPKQPQYEHEVVMLIDSNIPHLDPMHSVNTVSSKVNSAIFEGLYHYHYLKRPLTLEPSLAEDLPVISADGTTYSIKLKKGVYFQDDPAFPEGKGREVVAQDFIYSWKRLADPKNKALGWWVLDGKIEGLNEWRKALREGKANYSTPVSGLQAPDSHTLVIKLTSPSYQFMHNLTMVVTMVVAKEVVDHYGAEIVNHPVGTGPYVLEKWVRKSEVRLKKFENYRKSFYPLEGATDSKEKGLLKASGKQLPITDKVTLKIITERQPQWLLFLQGGLDQGIIPKDNNDQIFENNKLKPDFKKKGIKIHDLKRPDITYISFNMEHPVLGSNKKVRQAFASAIDKELIIKQFYSNRGIAAQSPIPPGLDAYDKDYKNPIQYDPEKAKGLLAEAGFPKGKGLPVFNFELENNGPFSRQLGEFLKDQLGKVGIQIKLIPNTWPQFNKKIKNKKADIFHMAWNADYPDSENFLQLFYSKNISPGSNNSNFINREYDALYESALKLPPSPERNKIYRQMVEFINAEVPTVFMIHRVFRIPYHNWLQNYNEFPIITDYYQYLGIDVQKKARTMKKL